MLTTDLIMAAIHSRTAMPTPSAGETLHPSQFGGQKPLRVNDAAENTAQDSHRENSSPVVVRSFAFLEDTASH